MNRPRLLLPALLLSATLPALAAEPDFADAVPALPLKRETFGDVWLRDRLSVGLGVSFATLTDAERPKDPNRQKTFVGYIWKLEDVDQTGFVPEARYWAARNLRLTLSLDRVSGRTRNFNLAKHSDGVLEATGPELLAEALWPLCDDTLILHAGAGAVYAFCDFEEDTWWHLGYASRDSWIAYGAPGDRTATDHYREIRVDDAFGLAVAAGVSWRPHPRCELDLSLRHVWLEPDCEFGYRYTARKGGFKAQQSGDFTIDHLAVAVTGSYVF